ncbi:MAG: zf-HC2 domain-containing protein [Planctomycetes bacterium]|nr:zf-HC2 domain-containing protein [Planctomycetota bacterium]
MTETPPSPRTCPGTPPLSAEDLVAWLDDELSATDARRVESHVVACPTCAGEADLLRRTGDLVARLPRMTVSSGFADRVVAAARTAPAGRLVTSRRWSFVRTAAAAAVVVAGVGAWWAVSRPGDPGQLTAREEDEIARDLYVLAHLDTLQSADADELARIADDLDVIDAVPSEEGNGG